MTYHDKYGKTHIKRGIGALSISRDFDTNPDYHYPVLLFTPSGIEKASEEHFHIPLSRLEAKKLRDWLNLWLMTRNDD